MRICLLWSSNKCSFRVKVFRVNKKVLFGMESFQEVVNMGVRSLAEAIILQSIEDLWNKKENQDCIAYFKGDAFDICARLAGMKIPDQVRLLTLLKGEAGY